MSNITAAAVNELRKRTDLPMMECKNALVETGGDLEKAVVLLRTRFSKVAGKRAENETAEGRIGIYFDSAAGIAAVIELRCESAPVAKSDQFVALANDLAKHVAQNNPANVEALLSSPFGSGTVTDRINEAIGLLRENMKVQRFTRLTGGSFGSYVHHDGSLGVLVQVTGANANPDLLKDVCMHIAASSPPPVATKREQVPQEVLDTEKAIAKAKAEATGKPANIAEKIAEGQMKTWFAENVLIEQPFVKDPSKTIGQLVSAAGLDITTFVRYKVGEVVK
jgi:elongation factor Ts